MIHDEYGEGTVTRITPKGRITVQFHEMRTCRVCLLSHLKSVCFHTLPLKQTVTDYRGDKLMVAKVAYIQVCTQVIAVG